MSGFFTLIGCSTRSKFHVETINARMDRISVPRNGGTDTIYRNTMVPITPRLEAKIEVLDKGVKVLNYQLQGSIHSSGLSINRVKRIYVEKEFLGDSLVLKHIVEVVRIAGKEGNSVMGYNYIKKESVNIPDFVKRVRIELYEHRDMRGSSELIKNSMRCIADTVLDIKH